MAEALTPTEALEQKEIHPDIINIINEFLKKRYKKGSSVTIFQSEIVSLFLSRNDDFDSDKLYHEGHMDFEALYRKKGWKVEYDKPGFNEDYRANFTFSAK